jgi:hypothetical protein
MNLYFYKKIFTPEEVEKLKIDREVKNKKFGFNNLDKEFSTKWIGDACEEAFEEYLDLENLNYKRWSTPEEIDQRDFTVGNYEIDVKGMSTNYPKESYACNISEKQWEKLMKPQNIVNTLIFVRFIIPDNTAIVLGAISKEEYKEKSRRYEKGTNRGKIILNTTTFELPIYQLHKLEDFFYEQIQQANAMDQ